MHREGPLKNIFKEDNWGDVGKASSYMYTRKNEGQEFDPNEKKEAPAKKAAEQKSSDNSQNNNLDVNASAIKEQFDRLKLEKDQEVAQIVQKINDLISRQNKIENSIEDSNNKIKELSEKITLYLKKPAPETQKIEKRAPVDTPIDRNNVAPSDVTIEKMFNFSNKKF